MATKKAKGPVYAKPSRSGSIMTLGLAGNPLVGIGFRMAPMVPTGSGRIAGHTVCATHKTQTRSQSVCDECGGPCETVTAYEWDDKMVTIDKDALGAANDKRLELQALVDAGSIDPLYCEKSYMLWPDAGHEDAFDLFAAALRESGKAAVGTAVVNKATKAIAVRWSQAAGCLVAHACTYDARIVWADVEQIQTGIGQRKQPTVKQAKEAVSLFAAALADSFDMGAVEDSYALELEAAVEAAAAGVKAPAKAKAEEPTPVGDLMAALRKSVEKKPVAA